MIAARRSKVVKGYGGKSRVIVEGQCNDCEQWLDLIRNKTLPSHAKPDGMPCNPPKVQAAVQVVPVQAVPSGDKYQGVSVHLTIQPGNVAQFALRILEQTKRGQEFGRYSDPELNLGYYEASNGVRIQSYRRPQWLPGPQGGTLNLRGSDVLRDDAVIRIDNAADLVRVVAALTEFNCVMGAPFNAIQM